MSRQDVSPFPSDTEGLPECRPPEIIELAEGQTFDLRIAPVVKRLGDDKVRMLAYSGSIPGPVLKVREGSRIVVNVENQGDLETTVHCIDRETGAAGQDIEWRFAVGDQVKIRLVNEMESDHPMHHPFSHSRSRSLPGACARRRRRAEPRVDGHDPDHARPGT